VEKTDDADRQKAAKAHLAQAVERFKEAVRLAPENLLARLGYAWTLEQSGATTEAVKGYRALIEDAWKKEKDLKKLNLGGHTIVAEAAGYLIPLLDRKKDKEEIAALTERAARLRNLPRPVTPVAVPLCDGLGARDIEDTSAAVAFDADGSGLGRKWTWVTRDAGWLVYDAKGRGNITSGLQMFGGITFWLFWETGYDALASLDDNGDGMLAGAELEGLAIWHDADGDGVCDPGEMKPLSEYSIVAVSCQFERDPSHPDRVAFSPRGVTFRDGRTRPTFDLILKRETGSERSSAFTPPRRRLRCYAGSRPAAAWAWLRSDCRSPRMMKPTRSLSSIAEHQAVTSAAGRSHFARDWRTTSKQSSISWVISPSSLISTW
jgi:hypothetical protein